MKKKQDTVTMTHEEFDFYMFKSLKEGQNVMARYLINPDYSPDTMEKLFVFLTASLQHDDVLLPDYEHTDMENLLKTMKTGS